MSFLSLAYNVTLIFEVMYSFVQAPENTSDNLTVFLEVDQISSSRARSQKLGITITELDRKSTRLNSSHSGESRMPSSA